MKISTLSVLTILIFACSSPTQKKPRQDAPKEVHQLLHLLYYAGVDYPKALQDDKEWSQHKSIAGDLSLLSKELKPGMAISDDVDRLKAAIEERGSAEEVQKLVSELQREIQREYTPLRSPDKAPDLKHGESMYSISCVNCHGKDGRAQTNRAQELKTHPASLIEPSVIGPLSPYHVYNFLRFGLGEMPSFELLSDDDRWDLAFYVFTLQFAMQPSGEDLLASLPAKIPRSFEALADLSDNELRDLLQRESVDNIDAALRALRKNARE